MLCRSSRLLRPTFSISPFIMQSSSCNASTANILVVGNPEESYMSELDRLQELGDKVRIVGFASSPDDAESGSWEDVNVMFNCTGLDRG